MEFFFAVVVILQLMTACKALPSCGDEVTITPSNQIVKRETTANIQCHGPPNISVTWFFIPTSSSPARWVLNDEHHQINGLSLVISNVMAKHAGEYFCEKLNPPSCITSYSVLTIFEKASITINPKEYRRYSGETLNLTAEVTGNPLPTAITLEKLNTQTGEYVDYPNTKYTIIALNKISIPNLLAEDNGKYRVCVENTPNSIDCDVFTITITDPPIIDPIHPITVKEGDNFSVVCRIIGSFGSDYEMSWQTATGNELTNGRVTRLNSNEMELFVEKVTEDLDYMCIVSNGSRPLAIEYVRVYLTDVPSPPRDLNIRSTKSNGLISIMITWTAPETDNSSPLTSYYINVTVEGGDSTVVRIIPDMTQLEYFSGCKLINVSVTSENACGNSSAISSFIDTSEQCGTGAAASVESSESDDKLMPAIATGIVVLVIFAGLTLFSIIAFLIWWRRQKQGIKQVPSAYNVEALQSNGVKVNSLKMIVATTPPPVIKRTTSIRRYRTMLEVPRDSVMLRDVLYNNAYYELCKGVITLPDNENKTHEVMVKKAKQSTPSEEEHNIQEEIKMMSSIGVHENVVGLLRTCLSEAPVYLITEYFTHGDLLGFLRASRGHYGMYTISPGAGCKTHMCAVQGQDLLKMATQVAAGMNFLAEKKITHRSLCARNVLVGTGLQVKVYNYGPKADTEAIPHNYVKWMAPETLFDGTANTMSDVWSFGVTFWEIITIGGSPYPTTHPGQMRELLQTGHRLPKPDHCADALYTIMERSWIMDPTMRPKFSELHKQLDDMCKSKLSYLNSNLYNDEEYSQFEETHQLMTAL